MKLQMEHEGIHDDGLSPYSTSIEGAGFTTTEVATTSRCSKKIRCVRNV